MWQKIISAVMPRNCVGCGEALRGPAGPAQWEYLCGACAPQLRGVGEEACVKCATGVYGMVAGERICSVCRESPPPWAAARSLVRYTGPARGWIKRYKYADARWVEKEWGKLLGAPQYAWLKDFLKDAVILPVPLHPLKRFLRGFNQSEELSKMLLGVVAPPGARLETGVLTRLRWTRPQARLRREARLKNVRGAFGVREGFDEQLKARRVIVLDDVSTTGATLEVCVRALKKAGFGRVEVMTFARG